MGKHSHHPARIPAQAAPARSSTRRETTGGKCPSPPAGFKRYTELETLACRSTLKEASSSWPRGQILWRGGARCWGRLGARD